MMIWKLFDDGIMDLSLLCVMTAMNQYAMLMGLTFTSTDIESF